MYYVSACMSVSDCVYVREGEMREREKNMKELNRNAN